MKLTDKFNLEIYTHSDTAENFDIDNTPSDDIAVNIERLHELLNQIQTRFSVRLNRPVEININSGYRSPVLNKALNGSNTSQHCKGEAADIDVIGVSHDETYNYIKALVKAKVISVGQVIKEYGQRKDSESDDWIHISLGTKNEFLIKYPNKPYQKDLS